MLYFIAMSLYIDSTYEKVIFIQYIIKFETTLNKTDDSMTIKKSINTRRSIITYKIFHFNEEYRVRIDKSHSNYVSLDSMLF